MPTHDHQVDQPVDFPLPRQRFAQSPAAVTYSEKFVPPPVLRHDPTTLDVRTRRHIGLPYGGTVVVHYLKQNDWFLETSLALLGRHNTWDAGIEPLAFSAPPLIAALDDWPSSRPLQPLAEWNGKGVVEVMDSRWGSARMYGSPIIRDNGYISEGREAPFERLAKVPVEPAAPASGRWGRLRGSPRQRLADPGNTASSDVESSTEESSVAPSSELSTDSALPLESSVEAVPSTSNLPPPLRVQHPRY